MFEVWQTINHSNRWIKIATIEDENLAVKFTRMASDECAETNSTKLIDSESNLIFMVDTPKIKNNDIFFGLNRWLSW